MPTVLVVDDKPAGRELVRSVLENSGHTVFEARDGEEALRVARQVVPDLIILDIHMPVRDGFDVVEELRRDPQLAAIPIMALTASAMQGDRERAVAAGFTGYVTKPIRLGMFRSEVKRLLNQTDHAE